MEQLLVGAAVLFFFAFNYGQNYFCPKWHFFVQSGIALLSYQVYLQSSPTLALALFYFMSSSAYYAVGVSTKHKAKQKSNMTFNTCLFRSLVAVTFFCVLFLSLSDFIVDKILFSFPLVLFLSCVYRLLPRSWRVSTAHTGRVVESHGFGGNRSVDNTFRSLLNIACLFVLKDYPIIFASLTLLNIVCIVLNRATAGFLALFAALSYWYGVHLGHWWIIPAQAIFGFLVYRFYDRSLLSDSQRKWLWRFGIEEVGAFRSSWLTGCGVGSMLNLLPSIQGTKKRFMGDRKPAKGSAASVALWLHNDALQLFLEGGIIGCLLVAALVTELIFAGHPVVTAYVICWGVNSIFNFPNHLADSVFINCIVLKLHYGASPSWPL